MPNLNRYIIKDGPSKEAPRILIVKLSAIGDVTMGTGVAQVLRNYYPNAFIAWAVEKKSAEVVLGNPNLDEVILWPRFNELSGGFFEKLRQYRQEIKNLRDRHFDIAIDLQGLARSGLLMHASKIPIRIGYKDWGEGSELSYNLKVIPKRNCTRVGEYYIQSLRPLGIKDPKYRLNITVPPASRDLAHTFLESVGIGDKDPFVCLCPATTWPQKHWVVENWSALADQIFEKYHLRTVILGGPSDTELAERIQKKSKSKPAIAAGKMSLKGSAALLSESCFTVSVDTGLLFFCIATDTPVIGLFGPTTAVHLADEPNVYIVQKKHSCSPCRPKKFTCKNFDCMKEISVEDVLETINAKIVAPLKSAGK